MKTNNVNLLKYGSDFSLFGRTGFSFLCVSFLELQRVGTILQLSGFLIAVASRCRVQALERGLSYCIARGVFLGRGSS